MAEYGLTPEGFRRKRLPEIIQGLNDRVSDKLGLQIQTGANSVFGQLHGVYGNALAECWEQMEKIYFAMYPNTADGVSLSNSAALAGIAQISAEQTTLTATCYGLEGSHIPYHAHIASNKDTSMVFTNREVLKKISASEACEIHLIIPTVEVYENTSDIEDSDGRPPHSIEAVVEGGDPQNICDVILGRVGKV